MDLIANTAVRWSLALVLLFVGLAKTALIMGRTHRPVLPVELLVTIGVAETSAGTLLLVTRKRYPLWAALWLGSAMEFGSLFLALSGIDARECGCFGALSASIEVHVGIATYLVLMAASNLGAGSSGQVVDCLSLGRACLRRWLSPDTRRSR